MEQTGLVKHTPTPRAELEPEPEPEVAVATRRITVKLAKLQTMREELSRLKTKTGDTQAGETQPEYDPPSPVAKSCSYRSKAQRYILANGKCTRWHH